MMQSLKNIYHWWVGAVLVILNGVPARKLKIVGVTGTDGKTTTSHLIYEILKAGGKKVALVSTVGAFFGDEEMDTGFHVTNPDAKLLQPLLKKIASQGYEYLVLEVTSHGLDQNRLVGISFEVGVITNITHEHLDYHKTFENYRKTKFKLLEKSKVAVVNRDDPSFDWIKSSLAGRPVKLKAFAKAKVKTRNSFLNSIFNKYNLGAAEVVAKVCGVGSKSIREVADNFSGVAGRLEEIKAGQSFRVVVDFAHTPNGLKNLLTEMRRQLGKVGRIIVVFGCASERDITKRPVMGKIAGKLADIIIVTAEDPRRESLTQIYEQITKEMKVVAPKKLLREDDRGRAITLALNLAKKGDLVVIAGKGHEKSNNIGGVEFPWNDIEFAKKALRKIKG